MSCFSHLWLCRERVTQLAGASGAGKTGLSLALLASALTSLPPAPAAAEVWWVCSRSGAEAGVERVRAAGVEPAQLARLRIFVAVDADALAAALRAALAATCGIPLLLLDSAADVLGPVCAGSRNFAGLAVVQALSRLLHAVACRAPGGTAVVVTNDCLPEPPSGGSGSGDGNAAGAPAAAAAAAAAAASHLPMLAGAPLPRPPRLALGAAWAAVPDASLLLHGPARVWPAAGSAARLPRLDAHAALRPTAGVAVLPLFATCLQPECQAVAALEAM